jgi:hypothetical protein
MRLTALDFDRLADRAAQIVLVVGQEVGQVGVLGVAPQCLDGIKIWRVSGQPLEVDVFVARALKLRCLAFSGQSNSLFFSEKDGQSDGQEQAQGDKQTTPLLL